MSVLNICATPERVLIVTDTMQYRGKEAFGLGLAKCRVAANGRYAIAFRGPVAVSDTLVPDNDMRAKIGYPLSTWDVPPILDLASAAEAADLFEEVAAGFPAEYWAAGGGVDCLIAGPSTDGSSIDAFTWRSRPGDVPAPGSVPVRQRLPAGSRLAPGIGPHSAKLPPSMTTEQMVRVALVQQGAALRMGLPICIGGVIHLTTVIAAGASQCIAGLYPDYDESAAVLGDPNAEAVARWRSAQTARAVA